MTTCFNFNVKSFILCCSILSFWILIVLNLDVLQPFHVGNAQCPSTMVIGYHAHSMVLLWPIVCFSLCHCRWTIALTEGPHRCSLHLMNNNLSTPPTTIIHLSTPPTPPPIRPCPQPLLSTVHLIHSRRYWFSVGKIKKAMNFNAFCLSLSLSLSVIPPIHLFSTPSSPDPSLCCVLSWGKDKGEGDGTGMEGRGGGVGGVALGHFSFPNPGRSAPPPR